jgi:type II secretory pathway pseudopilin PulG
MSLIRPSSIRTNSGFTYIGLLILVAIMGVTLATVGVFWSTSQKRAKEQQLLFIGNQFSNAIYAYYQNPPKNGINQYPKRLEDLLQDQRQPHTVRYLRKIFADPITGSTKWGLVKGADGGIVGVYSLSEAAPLKTANFGKGNEGFASKKHYSEWQFTSVAFGGTTLAANSTPVNQAPVNTTPPEYQVPPVQPIPIEPNADQKRKRLCDVMRVNDARTCANQAIKFDNTVGAACMASANQRYTICNSGDNAMLPPLAVQYK